MKPFIYLASPHSHDKSAVREDRHSCVCEYMAELIELGNLVFSPIAHTHNVSKFVGPSSFNFAYWEELDTFCIERCDVVMVLCIKGWLDSEGIKKEVELATRLGKPIVYVPMEK